MDDLAEFRKQQHARYLSNNPNASNTPSPAQSPNLNGSTGQTSTVNNGGLGGGDIPPQQHQQPFITPAPPLPPFTNKLPPHWNMFGGLGVGGGGFHHHQPLSSTKGYRLGDGTNNDQEEEEEEEQQQHPVNTNAMNHESDEPIDDDNQNNDNNNEEPLDEEEQGDEDEEMPPMPNMPPMPGGFGGKPFPHFNPFHHHQPYQPFQGEGHALNPLNPSLASSRPKEKDEILSIISERVASNNNEENLVPTQRPIKRNIKKLLDICLEKIVIDLTPYQVKLKLLHPFIIQRLIELLISTNKLTRKKLDQMVSGGCRIVDLNLNYQYTIVNNDFLNNCLQYMVYLQKISFIGCSNITDNGTEIFKKLTNIISLNLNDTRVSDITINYVKRMTNLQELSLRNTMVTDKGVILLGSTLVNLELLDLSKLKTIGDSSMLALSSCTKLSTLLLNETMVTEKGIQMITKLPISHLSLSNCQTINNQALFFITMFGNTLNILDITGTKITGAGFVNFKRLKNITNISLPGRDSVTDTTIVHLNNMEHIHSLDFSDYIHLTSIVQLTNLTRLVDLSLSNTKILDDSLDIISKYYVNLENLNLDRTQVTDFGVSKLSTLSLGTLSLSSTLITGLCFVELKVMSSLVSLNISFNNNIEDERVLQLVKLPNLNYIDLRRTRAYYSSTQFPSNVVVRPAVKPEAAPLNQQQVDEEDQGDEGDNMWE